MSGFPLLGLGTSRWIVSQGGRSLQFQQPLFCGRTAQVTSQPPPCADDAVARDDQGNGIGSDRPAHSPGKAEIPRSFGNASIGFGLTVGNLSDFVPHPELKPGSPQMDGDIENFSFSLKIFLQLSKDRCRFGRIPLDPKVGKKLLQTG